MTCFFVGQYLFGVYIFSRALFDALLSKLDGYVKYMNASTNSYFSVWYKNVLL